MRSGPISPSRLLLVHGWGVGAAELAPLVDALGEGARCAAPDLPGFGARGDDEGPWGINRLSSEIAGWCAEGGSDDPPFLLGLGLGALLALAVMADEDAPAIQGLVLVSGTCSFLERPGYPEGQLARL